MISSLVTFSLGTVDVQPVTNLPTYPSLVGEWCAILPLVFHLTSRRQKHQMVGDIALHGDLHVPLFPRLGFLLGLVCLLQGESGFLDEISSKATPDTVFDFNWGSVFPYANGAASRTLIRYACSPA